MAENEINLYVYNQSFSLVAIIDCYTSLIWTDRYDDCGDFELTLPYESRWNLIFKKDYLVKIDFSDHWCIIEKLEVNKDEDQAATLIISGRSVESLLQRRIIPGKKEFGNDETKVNIQNSLKTLFNENIINPSKAERKISNFIFTESTDTAITKLTFAESYEGNDLLDIVTGICQDKHIGFQVLVNSSNKFEFKLFVGKDRSRSSNSTGYVIFSPYYDNLVTSNYFTSSEEYRNVMVVREEDDKYITVYSTDTEPSGLARREVFEGDSEMDDVELDEANSKVKKVSKSKNQIKTKAIKKLKRDYKIQTGFEGDIIPEKMYKYRINFNVGDKVQFEDSYGNNERVYISEVVISMDENGLIILPTFEAIDWE